MVAFATLLAAFALAQAEPAAPKPLPIPTGGIPDPSPPPEREERTPAADPATPAAPPEEARPSPPRPPPAAPPSRPATAPPEPAAAPARAAPPAPAPEVARPAAPPDPPAPDAVRVEQAARAFLAGLLASDPEALAAASADRFSFDGDVRTGADAIRRRWREVFASRRAPAPALGSLEILPAPDAVARHGAPPARVAALARPGAWVAIADLGGLPVALFLGKDGDRFAVLGMHD